MWNQNNFELMLFQVFHAPYTSGDKAPGGMAWIDYWQQMKGLPLPESCPCCRHKPTAENPLVGGHVWLSLNRRLKWNAIYNIGGTYITPVCDSCNKKYQGERCLDREFYVSFGNLLRI